MAWAAADADGGAPLKAGGWAELQGLKSRPELNGTEARVIRWAEERQRWQVLSLKAAEVLCVKAAALRGSDRESEPGDDSAAAAAILADVRRVSRSAIPAADGRAGGAAPVFATTDDAARAAAGFTEKGYHFVDGVLDAEQCAAVRAEVDSLVAQGALSRDGNATDVRKDMCLHFHPEYAPEGAPALAAALARIWGAAAELSGAGLLPGEQLRLHPEAQFAVYDAGDAFYKAHRDAPPVPAVESVTSGVLLDQLLVHAQTAPRRVTIVLYLNDPAWDAAELGGCLRLHAGADPSDDSGDTCAEKVDIAPQGGRFGIFDARKMLHEVLPTKARRAALTVWVLSDA